MGNKILLYGSIILLVLGALVILIEPTIGITMAVIAIFAVVGYVCYKSKGARYGLLALAFILLMGGSIYSGINLNAYYSATGGIFGQLTDIFSPNQVTVDSMSFSFGNVELKATQPEGRYAAKITSNDILKLEEDKTFGVFVNNSPCNFVETTPQYVRADYTYEFMDEDLQEVFVDTMHFRFILAANYTEFQIYTDGGSQAAKYWNYYFARNNFVVSIDSVDRSFNEEPGFESGVVDYALANFYIDEQQSPYLTQVYHIGESVEFPFPEVISRTFLGWTLDHENVIESYEIKQHTNFYALEGEEAMYNITYKFKDKVLYSERVAEGSELIEPEAPNITGYTFNYWQDENGEKFDFAGKTVTRDMVLTANCSGQGQNIRFYFALENDTNKKVDAGQFRIGPYLDSSSTYPGSTGDYSDKLTSKVTAGRDFTVNCFFTNWFTPKLDSQNRIRYIITAYDQENGTNQIATSNISELDFTQTGWAAGATITLKEINTDMTVLILVEPIYFNIEFNAGSGSSSKVLATLGGLTYGETFNIRQLLTNTEVEALLKAGASHGWYTYEKGGGTRYFDSELNMLKPWEEIGYSRYGGMLTRDLFYNPETKTFSLYAY